MTKSIYCISEDKTVTVDPNIVAHVNEAKETWRPIATTIPCFMIRHNYKIKPIYEVSNYGRVRNLKTKKIISMRYSSETHSIKMNLMSEIYPGIYSSLCYSPARVIFATYYPKLVKYDAMTLSKIKFKDGLCFNLSPDNLYMEKN